VTSDDRRRRPSPTPPAEKTAGDHRPTAAIAGIDVTGEPLPEQISTVCFASDPTVYNADPREGVSANQISTRDAPFYSKFLNFVFIDRNMRNLQNSYL
jgi:hypothetical protein